MNATKKELTNDEFIDVLDDIYPDQVDICGYPMYQSNILKDADLIAFREAKLNYEDGTMPYVCEVCEQEFEDFDHANNCCKVDHLVELLEQLGFVGTDVNLKISLLEYGILYHESTGYCIICNNPDCLDDVTDLTSILFGSTFIDIADIKSAIADMPSLFFDYVGSMRDVYYVDNSPVTIINDIKGYNGLLAGDVYYNLNVDDLTKSIQSTIDANKAAEVQAEVIDNDDV